LVRRDSDSVEFIYCACGCGFTRSKYGKWHKHRFIKGHENRGRKGKDAARFKTGQTRSVHGYVLILSPDHPYADKLHGYVREHRIVYEKYMTEKWGIRFIIHPSLGVHHINGIRDDNRIENLQLLTKAQHTSYHSIITWQKRRQIK